jgi:hypothetical protein
LQREAFIAVTNAVMSRDIEILDLLVLKKFPECIIKNIDHKDDIFINVALEGLHNFLFAGKNHPKT